MKQCQRLAQITERLRARDREFVQCFYKRPAQYELFDWRLFALLYHRGEAFKAALSVTAVGGLQYWSVVHQALCDEAEELGLKERIRGHPKGEKALLHPGLMSMCSAFPRPNAGELRAQVMLLKQLVLGEIRSQNITFGEDVSDERKAVLKDIYDGRVEDSKAVVTELETEEGKCKARLDSLHWDGKAEALHWALHNRDIRRTVLHTGDGVTWMEDFANHPAQEPYDPREVRDPPTMLPSQPETDRQGRIDSGTSLLAPTGQTEPASSPPGVRTRSSRTTKPL